VVLSQRVFTTHLQRSAHSRRKKATFRRIHRRWKPIAELGVNGVTTGDCRRLAPRILAASARIPAGDRPL